MKRLLICVLVIALTISLYAQSPQKFSYQAVIRNASGALVTNHSIGTKVSILQGSASGAVVYSETYSPVPQTNANGLLTIEIGSGIPVTGTFTGINWAAGPYFLKTETDPAGGTSYTITGTIQLLSVPYALYSKNSESIADNSVTSAKIVDGTIVAADLASNSINSSKIVDAGIVTADLTDNAVTSPKISDGTVGTDDLAPLAVTTDKINASAVTGAKIAQAGATSGQALKWNGSMWAPANDQVGSSLWTQNGSKIYYNAGNVGIGISDPLESLHVNGTVLLSSGDKKLSLFTQGIGEDIVSTNTLYLNYANNQNVSIGEAGKSNLLVSGKVGIGTTSPAGFLQISGNSTLDLPQLLLTESESDYARLSFKNSAAPTKNWSIAGITATTDYDSRCNLWYWNGSTGTDIVSIAGHGSVTAALGLSSPNTFLEVHSNTTYSSGITPVIRISDNFKSWNIGLGYDGDRFAISSQDNTERLTILKSTGYVGIGTTAPSAGLHIKANSWPGSFIYLEGASGQDEGLRLYEGADLRWHIFNDASVGGLVIQNYALNVALFCQQSTGNVGLGTTSPNYKLTVNGTAWCSSGAWTGSDARWKRNITDLNNKLSDILELDPVSYELRTDEFPEMGFETGTQIGLIAQDVEKIIPGLVKTDNNGFKAVSYEKLSVVLLEGMKEQQKQIEEQQKQIDELKRLVQSLMNK